MAAPDTAEVPGGLWGDPDREEARKVIRLIMDGQGGRNAVARLAAAKLILGVKQPGDAPAEEAPAPMTAEQVRAALRELN